MALSPEFRPPLARRNVSPLESEAAPLVASDSDSSAAPGRSSGKWEDRSDTNANRSTPYIFGVMALISIGYVGLGYYYWPVTNPSVASSQTSTTVKAAIVFVPPENSPVNSATAAAAASVAARVATAP